MIHKPALTALLVCLAFPIPCFAQDSPLAIYGYSDLVFRDFFEREFPNGATENPPPTFLLLRTHVLLNAAPADRLQSFVNVRFENAPLLGEVNEQAKGGLDLLEAWFEYDHADWLRIRGGQFLAPFGYFNVRKFQSPRFNSVVLPVMYEEEFLRRAAAGSIIPPVQNVQVHGRLDRGSWTVGYHLYTGNGSETDPFNLDVNRDKGIGARIWTEPPLRNLVVGASYYTEEGTFAIRPHVDLQAMMATAEARGVPMSSVVPILPVVREHERRSTWGFDARYAWVDAEVRGEFVQSDVSELALVDAGAISDGTATYSFDDEPYAKRFFYVNANYTVLDRLTPYFEFNLFEDPRHVVFRNQLRRYTLGAAFRPIPSATLKLEFHNHTFGEEFDPEPSDFGDFGMMWFAVSVFFS